jgi:hypothetical protein
MEAPSMKALALSVVVAVGLTAAAGDLWARGGGGGGGGQGKGQGKHQRNQKQHRLQKRAGGQGGQGQSAAGDGGQGMGQGQGQGQGMGKGQGMGQGMGKGQGKGQGQGQDAAAKLVEMRRGRLQRLEETRAMLAEEGNARGVADMDALIARERSRLNDLTSPAAPTADGGAPQNQGEPEN